ncbi:hypothetical protein HBH76_163270 [Parastagonospora nodorum]|nr:hypothetical protein HBI74_080180 [Parastagonospora nodorum]KAH5181528.1 hypothetical protein HBH76_163270 [Parastagonospora nodorum]
MCLRVTHKYGCGHEVSANAPCATSRSQPCGVQNDKTVKHEGLCEPCDIEPSSIWDLKETPEFDPIQSSRRLSSEPGSQWETRDNGARKEKEKEKNTHVSLEDGWERTNAGKARTGDDEPENDGGLVFMTATNPADFKSKTNMTKVRKKAMDSFMKSDSGIMSRSSAKSKLPPASALERPADSNFEDSRIPELSSTSTSGSLITVQPTQDELELWIRAYRLELSISGKTQEQNSHAEWPKVQFQSEKLKLLTGFESQEQAEAYAPDDVQPMVQDTGHIYPNPAHSFQEPASHTEGLSWSTFLDMAERRRIQNRIAQRNYRKKLKRRLEDLERRAAESSREDEIDLTSDMDNSSDPQVMAYQGPSDVVTIECVCGNTNDHRFIIPCIACGKWQHITCYYGLAQDIVESHECSNCSDIEPTGRRRDPLKRERVEDLELMTNTSAIPSQKRPKTAGGASSVNVRTDATSQPSHIDDDTWSSYSVLEFPRVPRLSETDKSVRTTSLKVNQVQSVNTKERSSSDYTEQDFVTLAVDAKDEPLAPINTASDEHVKGMQVEEQDVEIAWEAKILTHASELLQTNWTQVQDLLPESWKWDIEYQNQCWTCTPLEPHIPTNYPLNIARSPVVLPVEYRWPPVGGMNPPPDPRPSAPIDCRSALQMDVVCDVFLTFEGITGFYLLISGLLQLIVPEEFDVAWAASHLPHKYGGLKVCYIVQSLEPTMLPLSTTETSHFEPALVSTRSGLSSIFKQSRSSSGSLGLPLKLNDFIEARPKSGHRKEKYAARIGLKVAKAGEPYLVMSTHVIAEAILARSYRTALFPRTRGSFDKLEEDWNKHVEIWAHNERIGTIHKSFDEEAEIYPNGFCHDVTLIKPSTPASVKDMASPMPGIGWLNQESWSSLRQQTSAVKILGLTEAHRSAKSIKCSRPSEILVVGEGIFLNQTAATGNSKAVKDHDVSTWKSLVSRALLYRVYPDFDPPNGYSGVALYADGTRQDGTAGPGIVGFQSFVQRSGHVQSFNMEGPALDRRLQLGRVAFHGAFEVPEELKRDYTIV